VFAPAVTKCQKAASRRVKSMRVGEMSDCGVAALGQMQRDRGFAAAHVEDHAVKLALVYQRSQLRLRSPNTPRRPDRALSFERQRHWCGRRMHSYGHRNLYVLYRCLNRRATPLHGGDAPIRPHHSFQVVSASGARAVVVAMLVTTTLGSPCPYQWVPTGSRTLLSCPLTLEGARHRLDRSTGT